LNFEEIGLVFVGHIDIFIMVSVLWKHDKKSCVI
jgi:hypothetical protein